MQKMDEKTFEKFAAALLFLAPNLPLNKEEICTQIKTNGLERFMTGLGSHVAALAETAELIASLEEGGLTHVRAKSKNSALEM